MFERANIHRMDGYVPGAQPSAPATKLNTNENPQGPSAAVMAALAGIGPAMLQRYPDPLSTELRTAIARYHAKGVDQVIATNGSDELLRLAVTTFADPGTAIGVLDPGYDLYNVLARIQDCPIARIGLRDDWLPPYDIARQWNETGARLALIANPQAPTGILLSRDWIMRVAAEFRGVLLIDEAYVDFVDPALGYDLSAEIGLVPNLLISRTLSKGHSLAGLRLGYGLGPSHLIAPMLHKVRDSYNIDAIAQMLGRAAFDDPAHARHGWDLVRSERNRLSLALEGLGIATLPSQGNFLLAHVPAATFGDAGMLHTALAGQGIHVRWLNAPRLAQWLRITIGTPAENDRLLAALRSTPAIIDDHESDDPK